MGVLFLITTIVVLLQPTHYFPDSTGYLNMMINRTPGYPIFLKIIQAISGSYFEVILRVVQTTFGCFSVFFFIRKIKNANVLNNFLCCCLSAVLLLPFLVGIRIGNNVLTEAISYGMYVIVIGYFIAFFVSNHKKELFAALPVLAILLITRYQFVYLIPVALLLIFWNNRTVTQWKPFRLLIISFLCLPILTSLIDRTYHTIVNNHFVSTPWTGMNIITAGFYIADAEDEALFTDTTQKEFFQKTYADLATKQLNIHHLSERKNATKTQVYVTEFANITMGSIFKNGNQVLPQTLSEDEKYIALEYMTKSMAKPLITNNFSAWIKLYVGNVIHGFGGVKYVFLYFIILLISFLGMRKYNAVSYKIVCLVTIILLCNLLLVAVGMHAIIRFTFYNDWVLFFILFILVNSLNKKLYEA